MIIYKTIAGSTFVLLWEEKELNCQDSSSSISGNVAVNQGLTEIIGKKNRFAHK